MAVSHGRSKADKCCEWEKHPLGSHCFFEGRTLHELQPWSAGLRRSDTNRRKPKQLRLPLWKQLHVESIGTAAHQDAKPRVCWAFVFSQHSQPDEVACVDNVDVARCFQVSFVLRLARRLTRIRKLGQFHSVQD